MLSCLVDRGCYVYSSGSDPQEQYVKYKFDLERRTIVLATYPLLFPKSSSHDKVARDFFDQQVGTPEKLVEFARNGNLPKLVLARLLKPDAKRFYLEVCASIEKALTEICKAKNAPCLEGGCAMGEDEKCLNACLSAGELYSKACANVWIDFFSNPNSRIDIWKS